MLEKFLARRSVRQYTDEPIPQDKLDAILLAGLSAPTSKNRRPWEFILVQDREMLTRLNACRPSAGHLLDHCAAAIVVAADQEAVDVWVEDASAAIAQMHLMASMQGVGSCWMQVRLREAADGRTTAAVIRELLGIPEKYGILAILTLGMPANVPAPHTPDELPLSKIHREHF